MKLKIHTSPAPTQKSLLKLMKKESATARKQLEKLSLKIGDGQPRYIFKSTVPETEDGQVIAEIRNNLSHIRCCVNSIESKYKNSNG